MCIPGWPKCSTWHCCFIIIYVPFSGGNCWIFLFVWEFIVLTMTTAAMYSMSLNRLDVWERVTLGLTEIWTNDPLPMIPHQVETQFIASQPFPVSVSGLIPSLSAAPVPCWFRKGQNQAMVTQTVREYPHQLGCQTLHYKTLPRISPCLMDVASSIFLCTDHIFKKKLWCWSGIYCPRRRYLRTAVIKLV